MLGFDHLQTDCARNVIGALTPPTSGLPRTAYYLVGHIQVTCITDHPIRDRPLARIILLETQRTSWRMIWNEEMKVGFIGSADDRRF
jgi:hypothetical protein